MVQNKHGVFVEGFEEIEIGNCYTFGVQVAIGEHEGKWGYALTYAGKNHGHASPFTPRDLRFSSRIETLKHAREQVLNLDEINEFTEKMIEEIYEKLGEEQLELF